MSKQLSLKCCWEDVDRESCEGELYLDKASALPMCKYHSELIFRLRWR